MIYTELFKLKDILINNIKNIIFKNKIRKRKLTLEDIISYRFYYSEYNKTKQSIISSINYENNKVKKLESSKKWREKTDMSNYHKERRQNNEIDTATSYSRFFILKKVTGIP